MRVGVVGVGAMGLAMAGHAIDKGFAVVAYDVAPDRLHAAEERGAEAAPSLTELARRIGLVLVMVATDEQARQVTQALVGQAASGSLVAIGATINPGTMRALGKLCTGAGLRLIDAPVVYGLRGALDGELVSLCGGSTEDVDAARPVLMTWSKDVLHVGGLGAGQLAKACNNLLHWIHSVGNYEALLLAKRYGVDAQRMREVLLQCPATNGTLERWDGTRFTWQEKDMDLVLDLAQAGGLTLPLTGQVDQLIKLFSAADVKALLHGPEASYLGRTVTPLPSSEGGLGDF